MSTMYTTHRTDALLLYTPEQVYPVIERDSTASLVSSLLEANSLYYCLTRIALIFDPNLHSI